MDFDFYRNFITVVEEGSITSAAKKLSMAQPALGAQIKTIESCYKVKLLKTGRGIRKIELTEAGELFLQKAKRICMVEENLFTEMSNLQKGEAGRLSFSISPGATSFFIQKYLQPFARHYPKISYEIHEVDVSTQIRHIEDGISDFAFANAPLYQTGRFNLHKGEREYLYVVYAEDNKFMFAPQEDITLQQLALLPVSCNFGCKRMLKKALSEENIVLQTVFTATTANAAIEFAAAGNSVAVVAGNCLILSDGLLYKKIADNLYFEQTLFWGKDTVLSNCAEKFLGFYSGQ